MKKRKLCVALISLAVVILVGGGFSFVTGGSPASAYLLPVNGDAVEIFRDEFGVPHIFAETDRGLFVGFGYAVAEDRLWQLEVNRRAARGQLAEILGPDFLDADIAARTVGYTEAELTAMFRTLPLEVQARFQAYAEGINRYITEVVLSPPFNKLPLEYIFLSLFPFPGPSLWTVNDLVAFGAFRARNFGEIGGDELENQDLLQYLITERRF
jgi:penicillin amidase